MAAQQAKALRIGVVRTGKIVEERILPGRQPVTIGTGSRNTIVIPGSGLPVSAPLFTWHGERCSLVFGQDAQGRIQGPQGEADLPALVAQGLAARQGGSYVLPIREDQRGKVVLGEVSVLWQFVTPAPEAPRPAIPNFEKGSHFQSLDRLFLTLLIISFVIHVAFTVWMVRMPAQAREVTLEEIPDRYARMFIPERKVEPPKPLETAETGKVEVAEATETKKDPTRKPGDPGPDTAEKKAARAAAAAKAVQSKGILKVLGALGPGASGRTAVADVFGKGSGNSTVAEALAGAGGMAIGDQNTVGVGQRKGGGQGGAAGIGDLATSGGGGSKVGYGARAEAKVTGSVAQEAAEVDSSEVDPDKLRAFVKPRLGLVKACYENALKRNPALRGKVRIRFTILPTGGLQDVTVEGIDAPDVIACIANNVRAWRTPFRPSGPVSTDLPLLLAPAGG